MTGDARMSLMPLLYSPFSLNLKAESAHNLIKRASEPAKTRFTTVQLYSWNLGLLIASVPTFLGSSLLIYRSLLQALLQNSISLKHTCARARFNILQRMMILSEGRDMLLKPWGD